MWQVVLRSLWYYRRTHAAVMLAVLTSTAVIGGALVIGDSVRYSLQAMSLQRLGHVSHVLQAPRFFREALAAELQSAVPAGERPLQVLPALLLTGTVEATQTGGQRHRAGSTLLLGVTAQSWPLLLHGGAPTPSADGIVLGYRTAQELQVSVGSDVSVWIERPSSIPRDSLLGEREDVNLEIVLSVEAILEEAAGASRFSLNPGQQLPLNAFVALSTLQERLGLDATEASRRNPVARPARVNTLLVAADGAQSAAASAVSQAVTRAELAAISAADQGDLQRLSTALEEQLKPADVGIRLRAVPERGYVSVESDSMILEDAAAEAAVAAAGRIGMQAVPVLVYLANELRAADAAEPDTRYSMYSIMAGLPFDGQPPLGPFALQDGSPIPPLQGNDIILSHWLSQDLQVQVGDVVAARWHEVGSHGELPETHQRFTVRGILPEEDPVSVDQDLTPFVDGVTNVDSFGDWDQPFEMQMDRITSRDDDYWADRRATPKAFISLAAAEKFWSSRFGRYTSIRVAAPGTTLPEDRLNVMRERLSLEMGRGLEPRRLGLWFRPVRLEGLQSAVGANDFSVLFLAFSGFLILSAILLAALMFRLGVQQRTAQIGLLEALGFTAGRARWMFLSEGLAVALAGTVAGAAAAVGFARLMLHGLTHWWSGAIGTQFLLLWVRPETLLAAAVISLSLAALVIWLALRGSTRRPPRELLSGAGSVDDGADATPQQIVRKRRSSTVLLAVCLLLATGLPAALLAGLIPGSEAFSGFSLPVVVFFVAGFAWLLTGLLVLQRLLVRRRADTVSGPQIRGLWSLAMASASRSPQRSLLTTALIAFATFVIVVAAAARRNPVSETPELRSGNGGFSLVAEASQPILFDLNTADGRLRLQLDRDAVTTIPQDTRIFGFSMQPGQDASCLNLYQTAVPTLLGASDQFVRRGGFRFANTPGENPWLRLNEDLPEHSGVPAIPVIGDLNTLQYSLKKGLGDVILYPTSEAPQFALQIVGMLDSSVFQGVLVMTDSQLKRLAPEVSGSRYFLVETPGGTDVREQTATALETGLNAFGVDTEAVNQRLAGFLAVQNTYLSTFQMLGGLGLLVGTFGLSAVMLRNVLERRSEIALLKAVGFTTQRVVSLILIENSVLLFWGILTGTLSALIAMLPHLRNTGADVPWLTLALTLVSVAFVGSLAAALPVRAAVQTSIRENLAAA